MNSRKWYALCNGSIVLLGEFDDFDAACDHADEHVRDCIWVFDHATAVEWKETLQTLTTN